MGQYIFVLFLGVLSISNEIFAQTPAVLPAVSPTALTTQQPSQPDSMGAGGDVDSAIQMLYSQIPTILTACSQLKAQVEQGLGYIPNTSSPVPLIIQYIELQDIQVSCDMIMQTKQLTDQLLSGGMDVQDQSLMTQNLSQTPPNPPQAAP